jgi:putative ABC transport system permease protein
MLHYLLIPLGVLLIGLLLLPMLLWDKGRRSLVLALRSLWLHKLRSFLSVLGIIIGTSAVIALMAFGEGSMQDALADIERQGATNVIIRSVKPPDEGLVQKRSFVIKYGLEYADYERFKMMSSVIKHVPMRIFPQEVRHLELMSIGRVVATNPTYADVHKIEMASGRFLTEEDVHHMENVAVLGSEIAESLFPFNDPLGRTVVINKQDFRIVGVVTERMPTGGTGGSQAAEEFNHDVYIPLSTSPRRFGEKVFLRASGSRSGEEVELHQVTLTISEMDKVRDAGEAVRDALRATHPKKDWAVTVPLDRLEEAKRAKNRYKMLLVLIASISLLVGGIGIMNIMLATVTERTREIGIRRALGAKRRDITLQFLVEAVAQTSVGGLVGVLLGLGLVFAIPMVAQWFDENLPAQVHVPSIFLSIGVAVGVGVLFGWYPARRAALLDPIEALRHE